MVQTTFKGELGSTGGSVYCGSVYPIRTESDQMKEQLLSCCLVKKGETRKTVGT